MKMEKFSQDHKSTDIMQEMAMKRQDERQSPMMTSKKRLKGLQRKGHQSQKM